VQTPMQGESEASSPTAKELAPACSGELLDEVMAVL
jgi:hypothetical protein